MKKHYIKYPLDYKKLFRILQVLNKKRVNFFIDIQSISTGFYNKNNVFMELTHYVDNNKVSDIYINELRDFLNGLYRSFKKYDPFFVLFYDDGYCQQNKVLYSNYKTGRANIQMVLMHDEQVELYRQIKRHYYKIVEERFNKPDLSKVYYLREYEADFVPYFCVVNDLFDSKSDDILNIILSNDKDLMQTCQYQNTVQCTVTYNLTKSIDQRTPCRIFDDVTAMSYIDKKLVKGMLTSKHIPMLLAIAGDKSDGIPGIKGIGPVKAANQIINWNIPPTIDELRPIVGNMSSVIQDNFDLISLNYKLIDFSKQIERVSVLHKFF